MEKTELHSGTQESYVLECILGHFGADNSIILKEEVCLLLEKEIAKNSLSSCLSRLDKRQFIERDSAGNILSASRYGLPPYRARASEKTVVAVQKVFEERAPRPTSIKRLSRELKKSISTLYDACGVLVYRCVLRKIGTGYWGLTDAHSASLASKQQKPLRCSRESSEAPIVSASVSAQTEPTITEDASVPVSGSPEDDQYLGLALGESAMASVFTDKSGARRVVRGLPDALARFYVDSKLCTVVRTTEGIFIRYGGSLSPVTPQALEREVSILTLVEAGYEDDLRILGII